MKFPSAAAFHIRVGLLILLFLSGSLTFMVSMLSKTTVLQEMSKEVCPGVRPVDQVVVILIDALRPDFALKSLSHHYSAGEECTPQTNISNNNNNNNNDGESINLPTGEKIYQRETLKYIEESLQDMKHPSHGFFFVADSPTTTCQRLKALATGTMPAFLEAGANLNTDEVMMDSLFRQLRGRSVLLGDDTWLNLFPNNKNNNNINTEDVNNGKEKGSLWKETIAYPPFNVSDFDTNDRDVIETLLPLLTKETKESQPSDYAKFIIAHFLGVDHIGHRHNADHPQMDIKLAELDKMLRNVSNFIHNRQTKMRTLLVVLGDHGMTNSGDHGGDSYHETDTFMYTELIDTTKTSSSSYSLSENSVKRKTDITERRWIEGLDMDLTRLTPCRDTAGVNRNKLSATHQIDITPTIATLLGIPIPFSNFGRIIPELAVLVDDNANTEYLEECNWKQLVKYFEITNIPMDKSWVNNNISWRKKIADMSYFARKSRSEMKRDGMFIGSCLFLIAALSLLRTKDVIQYIKNFNLIGTWSILLFILRVCTVFANSFILKEDVEILCLLQLLLIGALMSSPNHRICFSLILLLLCLRILVPLLCHSRSHITHVAAMVSPLEEWISINLPEICWPFLGITIGGIVFTLFSPSIIHTIWLITLINAMYFSFMRPVIHHSIPLVFFLLTTFSREAGRPQMLRYVILVLWSSSLCNENYLASAAIALHGAILPLIIKLTEHTPAITQAILLHFLAWISFFTQGNQCLFNTLDLNASFVGISSSNLLLGGVFVITRTFNSFALTPIAIMLNYNTNKKRGWKVCYLLIHLAVFQGSMSCFNGYIQKSHLMLFSIFCPKLMYDVVICLMTGVGYFLACLMV